MGTSDVLYNVGTKYDFNTENINLNSQSPEAIEIQPITFNNLE